MSKKINRVSYELDTSGIKTLPLDELYERTLGLKQEHGWELIP